ncbi:putative aminopeptidase [Microdochium bolleyi]|uniref:Aminopeptidase n=1 Tax=Microdochium bolleyi TaxID=196109 RepID=A0A136IM70_9PEZI|nr:putative aminopeptidase [Microdochium bolleyi]
MLSKQTTTVEGDFLPSMLRLIYQRVTPSHYHLVISKLELGGSWCYHGRVTISANIDEPTSRILLHAEGLHIDDAQLNQDGENAMAATEIGSSNGLLSLEFKCVARPGLATITIIFWGSVRDSMEGFYRAKHDQKDAYTLLTQFEPCDARTAFPCFDEPRLKATFDLELEIPEEQTALANMPVAEIIRDGSPGTKRVCFERTPVMSTYLLAWSIGSFEYLEHLTDREHQGRRIPVRVYTPPGYSQHAQFAVKYAADTLDFFAGTFGVDYPLPKCDHVVVPEFISGAMENWGLITYRPPKILFDESTSDNRVKLKACYVIAHELAHQWFGNLVTMDWWNALWLNEGFATWAGYLAVNRFCPSWQIWSHFTSNVMSEAFELDSLDATHPIEAPVGSTWDARQMFDDISYLKGASVIRMLSQHLGEEVFLEGIAAYLQRHAYGTATTDELLAVLEEVSKSSVRDFMDAWIRRSGFPVLETRRGPYGQLGCCQCRFRPSPDADPSQPEVYKPWQIPVRIEGHEDAKSVIATVGFRQGSLSSPSQAALLPHDSSFCHIKYSSQDLRQILSRGSNLTCDEIIPLLRDIRAMVAAGKSPVQDLLDTCATLDGQDNVFVLAEIAKCVDLLESTAPADERISQKLLAYRKSLAKGIPPKVRWDIRSDDYQAIEYQRVILQTLLAVRDPATIQSIEQHYADWVGGRHTFAPSFRGAVLGFAVANMGGHAYAAVKASYLEDTTIDGKEVCLAALGRVSDAALARDLLEFVFSGQVALQNVHLAFASLGASGKGRVYLWEYVKARWDMVYGRLSKCAVVLNWCLDMGLSHSDDLKVRRDIEMFFADKDTSAFHRTLLVVLDRIKANAAARAKISPQLEEWAKSQ